LTGCLPDNFGDLTNLGYLYLNDNLLSGPIPDSLTRLVQLCRPTERVPRTQVVCGRRRLQGGVTNHTADALVTRPARPVRALHEIDPMVGCLDVSANYFSSVPPQIECEFGYGPLLYNCFSGCTCPDLFNTC
jgi:hypothetical protein